MKLSDLDIQQLLKRFPHFEASYEMILHKNLSRNADENYNVSIAIPFGRKYYLWFTFYKDKNVLLLMELNRERKIVNISIKEYVEYSPLVLGTIFYVSLEEQPANTALSQIFRYFIEDVYYYGGHSVYNYLYGEKLGFISDFFKNYKDTLKTEMYMATLWWKSDPSPKIDYTVHHIQHRCLNHFHPIMNELKEQVKGCPSPLAPHLSLFRGVNLLARATQGSKSTHLEVSDVCEPKREASFPKGDAIRGLRPRSPRLVEREEMQNSSTERSELLFKMNYKKPQYNIATVFMIKPDIKFDIYHLYACNKLKKEYCGVACIPNYKTSVFMNSIFRNIRENTNIDYIEESDTEEEFENIKEDKYVDLKKEVNMECIFNAKFKKWTPIRVVDSKCRIVHISKL
jgi:hypothetical protein